MKRTSCLALLAAGLAAAPVTSMAHIKWFNDSVNLMIPPRSLAQVMTLPSFLPIFLMAVLVLFAASLADSLLIYSKSPLWTIAKHTEAWCRDKTYVFLRVATAAFFFLLAYEGKVLLTPETNSTAAWIPTFQICIGITLLIPQTGLLAGLQILVLYGMCVEKYGLFHMLDYPAFVGVAIYFIWMSTDRSVEARALAVIRLSTAATFMIGAIEKFGYPNWTFPMLKENPAMTFGITNLEFYMMAAGMVEFALAYLLLFGRLSSKICAVILLALMIGGIVMFGWMDALGHALFLAALLVLSFTRNPIAKRIQFRGRYGMLLTAGITSASFAVAMPGAIEAYRVSNINLVTLCSTTPTGTHLHK